MPNPPAPLEKTAELTGSPAGSLKPGLVARITRCLQERETLLWWCHSVWSFLFGVGVMVLGARKPTYARIIIFHIGFIWATSLFLPVLQQWPRLSPVWAERLRLVVNYFNKNFYQQLLFFVIPVYYASTTFPSRNMVFLAILVFSAILSTLDVVYDRYLSVAWPLTAGFLAFNAFASVNVMLLVMFTIRTEIALYLSAGFAVAIFVSMLYRFAGLRGRWLRIITVATACFLVFFVHLSAPFIPPVMVSMGSAAFGVAVRSLQVLDPMLELPPHYYGRLVALTPIKAPFGLRAKVRHAWYLDGKLVRISPEHEFRGGRKDGYRYWSPLTIREGWEPKRIRVDLETSIGQLIGQATLVRAAEK